MIIGRTLLNGSIKARPLKVAMPSRSLSVRVLASSADAPVPSAETAGEGKPARRGGKSEGGKRPKQQRGPGGAPLKKTGKSAVLVTWLKEESDPESFEALVQREGEVDKWNAVECDVALRQMIPIKTARGPEEWASRDAIYTRLAARLMDAPKLQLRNLITVVVVASRLNVTDGAEWVNKALARMSAILEEDPEKTFSEPEVSQLMASMTALKQAPPAPVLNLVLSMCPALNDIRSVGAVLTGLAKLGLREQFAEAARAMEGRIQQAATAGDQHWVDGTSSIILHAYATTDTACPPELAKALLARMGEMANSRDPKDNPSMSHCAIAMWSLARLGFTDLFKQAEAALSPIMLRHLLSGRCSEQNISNILISASNLGVTLEKPLLKQLINQFKSKSKDCSAQALANSLNALANWQMDTEFTELAEDVAPLLNRFNELPLANAQAASTVLWSHSAALVELEPAAMQAVLKTLEADLAKANTRDIPFTFYAFAVLDFDAPAPLLTGLIDRALQLRKARTWNTQELCTAIYAAAVLGCVTSRHLLELDSFWQMQEALHTKLQGLDAEQMSPIDLSMLVQAWLLLDSEPLNANGAKLDKRRLISKQLWERACESRKASLAVVRKDKSDFSKTVAKELAETLGEGASIQSEVPVGPNGLLQVDHLVTVGGKQVVVECEGPSHFTSKRRVTGPTRARDLLLEREGYTVVALSSYEHRAVKKVNRPKFYMEKLAKAGLEVTVAA